MTAVQKIITRNPANVGLTEVVPTVVGGSSYAGQIPALDPTTGLLAVSMLPVGVGPDVDTSGVCGPTSLGAGEFVNFYNNAGTKSVRAADATDNTKPAQGFVQAGFTTGESVTVYLPGSANLLIPVGSMVAGDIGKTLYLGTSGGVTMTRPTTPGAMEQALGTISNVGTTTSMAFDLELPITIG